jgi:hypothetical protein
MEHKCRLVYDGDLIISIRPNTKDIPHPGQHPASENVPNNQSKPTYRKVIGNIWTNQQGKPNHNQMKPEKVDKTK